MPDLRPKQRVDYDKLNSVGMNADAELDGANGAEDPMCGEDIGSAGEENVMAGDDLTTAEPADMNGDGVDDLDALLEEERQRQLLLEQKLVREQKRLALERMKRKNLDLEAEIQRLSEESAAECQRAQPQNNNTERSHRTCHNVNTQQAPKAVERTLPQPAAQAPRKRGRPRGSKAAPPGNPAGSQQPHGNETLTVRSLRGDDALQADAERLLREYGMPGNNESSNSDMEMDNGDRIGADFVHDTREYKSKSCGLTKVQFGTNQYGERGFGEGSKVSEGDISRLLNCNFFSDKPNYIKPDAKLKYRESKIVDEMWNANAQSEDEFSNSEAIRGGCSKVV